MNPSPKLVTWCLAMTALGLSACSRPGVNAGRQGGVAFILFTIMLIAMGAVLWFFIGRED